MNEEERGIGILIIWMDVITTDEDPPWRGGSWKIFTSRIEIDCEASMWVDCSAPFLGKKDNVFDVSFGGQD
jgi:hypothetical protein